MKSGLDYTDFLSGVGILTGILVATTATTATTITPWG